MSRTRPSSAASRSSPPLALQPPTPSRRPSTPPSAKTLTPPRRSPSPASTLTPPRRSPSPASRRMSTGSTPALNRTRGPSPVKTNRISSSPKLQGWHSNVPGFSHDAPANLRTSLPDRPDHRKAPNDMFRPLLSSVPTTTFNAGKGNVVQRPMFSHNSYMTTSSNASSEHSASFGPYVDNDQEQHDQISEWDDNHQVHGDIFMFDKLDELNEETSHEETTKFVESDRQDIDMEKGWAAGQTSGTNSSHVGYGEMATCTRCGNVFKVMDVDRQGDYCEECGLLLSICSAGPVTQTLQEAHQQDEITANCKSYAESGTSIASDCVEYREEASLGHQFNDEPPADCIKTCSPLQSMVDTNEEMLLAHEVSDNQQASAEHEHFRDQINSHSESLPQCLPELNRQHNDSISQTACGDNYQLGSTAYASPKVENTDATGISVLLLQKSSSNKWPVVEGRTLSATNILCSEPYYTRDSISAMRRSFGRDSSSATSSIDLGSSRQSDVRFERLRSGKRGDFEKARMSSTMSHQSVASVSDMSISGSSASLCPQSDVIGDTCFPIDTLERSASRTTVSIEEHDSSCMDALSSGMECSSAVQPIINDEILVDLNTSGFHRLSETEDILIKNHNMEMVADNDHLSTNLCLSDIEMPSDALESSAAEESYIPKTEEDTSTKAHCYTISTLEHPSYENNFDDLQMQSEAVQSSNEENKSNGCCTLAVSEDDVLVSGTDTNIKELPNDESPEAVEGSRKQIQRCFTLEEAADTILLCSSIVHDLAYKAATIALDHEQERVHAEPTHPSVTIVGKSIPKEDGLLKLTHRRTPNRKVKRKRLEGETTITENAEKKDDISTDHSPVRSSSGITRTSESMKPPKLESKCNCVIIPVQSSPVHTHSRALALHCLLLAAATHRIHLLQQQQQHGGNPSQPVPFPHAAELRTLLLLFRRHQAGSAPPTHTTRLPRFGASACREAECGEEEEEEEEEAESMPPSPSLRRSPSKEISHRRGHSFGSTVPAKPKDDELALFNDMQKNEEDNFLLESSDNFDETIYLKLGVNIARREESRDFLNTDGDKNDYDWLLTPPETPLFRSLDDDEDKLAGPAPRGRAQTKPISISRSSTMENAQRSSRSSASPNRLSLSPRSSSSNTALTRTRSTNSSSRCSPPLSLQSSTPSRRSPTPPGNKTLTPPRRSPSPASRRMSATSSGPTLNGTRGASPVKTNRRSSSPKFQGWQSSDPGFSFDAPPNLRTSMSDRPLSHSRAGSPSSFSGLNMVSRGRRQSMSPTPSRRTISSHSTERDRFSSYSKASATSSGEDDLDSMQSVPIDYSSSPAVKKSLAVMKTRTIASSQKPSKSFSPSSAPKRSFDSAVWLMDHRKAPQSMFRPLLSSVPTTTFVAGKGNVVHRPTFSHISSVTTSSNASSEHGATFSPCVDIDHERHDLVGQWEANDSSRIHEEIFMFDKSDELNEGSNCHQHSLSTTCSGLENSSGRVNCVESTKEGLDMKSRRAADQISCDFASSSEVGDGEMATCTRCGKIFNVMYLSGGNYCEECDFGDGIFSAGSKIQTTEGLHQKDHKFTHSKVCIPSEDRHIALDCVEDSSDVSLDHQLVNNEPPADYLQRYSTESVVHTNEEKMLGKHLMNLKENISPHDIGDSSMGNSNDISPHTCSVSDYQEAEAAHVTEYELFRLQKGNQNHVMAQCLSESDCQHNGFISGMVASGSHELGSTGPPSLKIENTEGNGISVLLLEETRSKKWPIVEGRPLVTTNIHCLEPYYTADSISLMKRSIGLDSSSAASSIDLGPSGQSDVRFERLRSGKKGDFEKSQISCQSIASVSDMSISGSSASHYPQSYANGDGCHPIYSLETSALTAAVFTEEHDGSCKEALSSAIECWSVAQAIVNDDCEVEDEVTQNQDKERMARDDNLGVDMCSSYTEVTSDMPQSPAADGCFIEKTQNDSHEVPAITDYSVVTPEHPCDENNSDIPRILSETVAASDGESKLDDCGVSSVPEEGALVSARDETKDEGRRKQFQRCFTLEEATDTILFCSSIVHDLAYKAATVGLEREQEAEFAHAPRPTVTMVEKFIPREDGLSRGPQRRTTRRKVERKIPQGDGESITDTARTEVITKEPAPVRSSSEITTFDSLKPPKMESKCNCTIM
uniref:Proline-rich family protein n=1 Tax=Oryza meridionalis TaxID=40149 RepID=A0A0E0FAS4_9ORYZ